MNRFTGRSNKAAPPPVAAPVQAPVTAETPETAAAAPGPIS